MIFFHITKLSEKRVETPDLQKQSIRLSLFSPLPTASTIMFHSCLSDIQKVVPILRIRLLIKSSFLYFLYLFLFLRIYCSCCWFFFFLLASIFNGDFKATLYFQFTNLLTLICVANYYTILSLYYVYSAFYHTQILSFS